MNKIILILSLILIGCQSIIVVSAGATESISFKINKINSTIYVSDYEHSGDVDPVSNIRIPKPIGDMHPISGTFDLVIDDDIDDIIWASNKNMYFLNARIIVPEMPLGEYHFPVYTENSEFFLVS